MCAPGNRISEVTPRTWQQTDLIVSTLKGSLSVNQNPGPISIITRFFSDLKECRLHCPGHFCSQRSNYGCWPWVRQSRELKGQKGREPKPEGPYGSHQVKFPSPLQMERGALRPPKGEVACGFSHQLVLDSPTGRLGICWVTSQAGAPRILWERI